MPPTIPQSTGKTLNKNKNEHRTHTRTQIKPNDNKNYYPRKRVLYILDHDESPSLQRNLASFVSMDWNSWTPPRFTTYSVNTFYTRNAAKTDLLK